MGLDARKVDLIERIERLAISDTLSEPLDGVRIRHSSAPTELGHGVTYPALCVVAQGSKVTSVGGEDYRYDASHYLVTTSTLPITSRIVEASPQRPYLGVVVRLDPTLVTSVMVEASEMTSRTSAEVKAIGVSPVDADLLDVVGRMIRMIESPGEAGFLLPLAKREIVYRLLLGEQGPRLRHIAAPGGASHRIAKAIARLRREYDQPLRIEAVARDLGMSVSGFHHHFKAVTAMSPLQFQKQLRLQEARRLMLGEDVDAASAGYRVGYDDASHFNREYKRLFGAPPKTDVERLRGAATTAAGL
jgi:AraC-like DNA-binding protein